MPASPPSRSSKIKLISGNRKLNSDTFATKVVEASSESSIRCLISMLSGYSYGYQSELLKIPEIIPTTSNLVL